MTDIYKIMNDLDKVDRERGFSCFQGNPMKVISHKFRGRKGNTVSHNMYLKLPCAEMDHRVQFSQDKQWLFKSFRQGEVLKTV